MKLAYKVIADWPPNAWIIRLTPGADVAEVHCGGKVERADAWFCEATWDGPFSDGAFDETDIVAGSGVRVRAGQLVLVSSGSTVDRLQFATSQGTTLVSNSLACLLAECSATVDCSYPFYVRDFNSIVRGIDHYKGSLSTDRGEIEFVYFRNMIWDGERITIVDKPRPQRAFTDFEAYESFLRSSLQKTIDNMGDAHRTHTYTPLGTLSTGYDSTTVTALAAPLGLQEVICFARDHKRDLGSEIAHYFGVRPIETHVDAWRALEFPEVPFIAGNAYGEEVHYAALSDRLAGRVVLTGYHGDKVWDKNLAYLTPDIRRGDISGLALTEFRLWAGFVNCAIPFWGVRQLAEINRISRSAEMRPWDVGGDYTRPICRRIVESFGVPRAAFGSSKSFASRWFVQNEDDLTPASRDNALKFIKPNAGRFWRRMRPSPALLQRFDHIVMAMLIAISGAIIRVPGVYRLGVNKWPLVRNLIAIRVPNPPYAPTLFGLRAYYFPWAMARAKQRYEVDAYAASPEIEFDATSPDIARGVRGV